MSSKLTIAQALEYTIPDYLHKCGLKVLPPRGNKQMTFSPFREERTPSFSITPNGRGWFDFGEATDNKGNLIDLVLKQHGITNKAKALSIIAEVMGSVSGASIQPTTQRAVPPPQPKEPPIEIRRIEFISDKRLTDYLDSRGIDPSVAIAAGAWQCYYSIGGRQYILGLAFQNDKGGYAIRPVDPTQIKRATAPNGLVSITGTGSERIAVFEGTFDYLSALMLFKHKTGKVGLTCDCLVLNSTSFTKEAISILNRYKRVDLFLDNDPAGRAAVEVLSNQCTGDVTDYTKRLFSECKDEKGDPIKDLNQYLTNIYLPGQANEQPTTARTGHTNI